MTRLRNFLRNLRGCRHEAVRGVATYYERDLQIYLRLVQCRSCGLAIITELPRREA